MRVVGTAGHVDHGKSTLVRALTGIDPDRLKEEKARGMTIDLGFAWLEAQQTAGAATGIGIVDVPGHIDFIKNMLAGVGGIDAAILVIAADEGVMPQTREHLAILDLLAVPGLVVALTKIDAVSDAEWLDLVELDIDELLTTTRFGGAPVVRVSALRGVGLDALRQALDEMLAHLPPRRNRARPRLPIDRVFSLTGFGTVVTGTLSDGALAVGDGVEILPSGLTARIRGMQSHKQAIELALPGSRVALNLTGVSTEELPRGAVVVKPGTIRPTTLLDVRFRLLPDAPRALRHNQAVDFFVGASETPVKVRVLGVEQVGPGEEAWLQLRAARPIVTAAGDHYILRQPSPSLTLGGGTVVQAHPRRRWRRFDPAVTAQLTVLAQGTPDDVLLHTLERLPFATAAQLWAASGLDVEVAQVATDELRSSGALVALDAGAEQALVSVGRWESVLLALTEMLADFHRQFPLRRGMARGEVRSRLGTLLAPVDLSVRLFNALVSGAQAAGKVAADDTSLWLPGFSAQPSTEQRQRIEQALGLLAAARFAPPALDDVLRQLGNDGALLEMLVEQGRMVRVGPTLVYRAEEFEQMTALVRAHIGAQGTITLAEARDLFDASRKYAQAVLEEMDTRRVTRRVGDARVLR
jgi:selenocysteine-specific elongation factor